MQPFIYTIEADLAYSLEAIQRHRKIKWRKPLLVSVILAQVVTSIAFGAVAAMAAAESEWMVCGFALLLAVIILGSPLIDRPLLIRRLKRSPFFEEAAEVRIDDSGIHQSAKLATRADSWELATKAVEFPDGMLIYYSTGHFSWLPHRLLEADADPAEVATAIRERVADYQAVR